MMSEEEKLQHLIKMAARLSDALQTDIDALKVGRPKVMRWIDPEIQKLSLIYSREIASLNPSEAKKAPLDLRKAFFNATQGVRELLQLHMRYINRVRNASEGIIKAVAEDVERKRNAMRPYASPKMAYRPPPGAVVYNAVV